MKWIRKGGFAIVDQGLFAGTNFIMNVMLARWMSATDYGAFATAFSIFLLLGGFHTALITEPMLIFGSGKYVDVFRRYMAIIVYGHFGVTLLFGLILGIASSILQASGNQALAPALMGLAFATPCTLLLWVLRRSFYVTGRVYLAASGGALYLIVMLTGIAVLQMTDEVSSFSAFIVIGAAGIIVGLWLILLLKPTWHDNANALKPQLVLKAHWEYGRWSSTTPVLGWLPSNIPYILLPTWFGLQASAAYKAIMNPIMPVIQAGTAIGVLLLPLYVTTLRSDGKSGLNRVVRRVLLVFLVSSGVYWAFLFVFRTEILVWLYKGQYGDYTDLLPLAGLIPFTTGLHVIFIGVLRAMEHPDRVFWCFVVSTILVLTIGLGLTVNKGIEGALVTNLLATLGTGVTAVWLFRRLSVSDNKTENTDQLG